MRKYSTDWVINDIADQIANDVYIVVRDLLKYISNFTDFFKLLGLKLEEEKE